MFVVYAFNDMRRSYETFFKHEKYKGIVYKYSKFNATFKYLQKHRHYLKHIVTLFEAHITYNGWKDNSGLYSIPWFTFISKCHQNGELGGVGIYVTEKLKWKRS